MGYTTTFEGEFRLDRPLSAEQSAYLNAFSDTRRMRRDPAVAAAFPDPVREAVGLPIGPEGAWFVGGTGFAGQDRDASILDYNHPPQGQPGLWCQWVPGEDGSTILWNGAEKFYYYTEWLKYLIKHFLTPWGCRLRGAVRWRGENPEDVGMIIVDDNEVRADPL